MADSFVLMSSPVMRLATARNEKCPPSSMSALPSAVPLVNSQARQITRPWACHWALHRMQRLAGCLFSCGGSSCSTGLWWSRQGA